MIIKPLEYKNSTIINNIQLLSKGKFQVHNSPGNTVHKLHSSTMVRYKIHKAGDECILNEQYPICINSA